MASLKLKSPGKRVDLFFCLGSIVIAGLSAVTAVENYLSGQEFSAHLLAASGWFFLAIEDWKNHRNKQHKTGRTQAQLNGISCEAADN